MRHLITSTLMIISLLSSMGQGYAAKPVLTKMKPAGGQIGTKPLIKISGADKTTQIWCSHPGVKITPDKKKGEYYFDIQKDVLPGYCLIRLYNNDGASDLKPFLLGTIPEITEVEPNNKLVDAKKLSKLPVTINGVLHRSAEIDSFAVSLKKGETLVASISAHEIIGSPMDPVLQLVSSRGFVLEQNDDYHGFDPQIVFTSPREDTFYIRTFCFPAKPNSTIQYSGNPNYLYRLTVTTGPYIDYSLPLNINRQPSAVTSVVGWNIPEKLKQLPVSLLPDSNLAIISSPLLANSYQLESVKHPSLVESKPDQDTPQSIMIPSSVTGVIQKPGDVDVYQFLVNKNQKINFKIESFRLGHPLDSVIKLKDAKGKVISEIDDVPSQKDPELSYTFKEAGMYSIEVTDRFSHGGSRYVYLLTSTEPSPNYSIEVGSNAFLIPKDKPLEIPVTIKRVLFHQKLKISTAGLPKEIEAKEVLSEIKGDSSKTVKLILKNTGDKIWSGPFQIVAVPENDTRLSKKATAPIANLKKKTQDLWLTALKPAPEKKTVAPEKKEQKK